MQVNPGNPHRNRLLDVWECYTEDYSHITFECKASPHNFCGEQTGNTSGCSQSSLVFCQFHFTNVPHSHRTNTSVATAAPHKVPILQYLTIIHLSARLVSSGHWQLQYNGHILTQQTHQLQYKDTLLPHSNKNKNTTQFQLRLSIHDENGILASQTLESTSI